MYSFNSSDMKQKCNYSKQQRNKTVVETEEVTVCSLLSLITAEEKKQLFYFSMTSRWRCSTQINELNQIITQL